MTHFTRTFSAFAAVIATALLAIAPLATPTMAADVSDSAQSRPVSHIIIADLTGGAMDGTVAA